MIEGQISLETKTPIFQRLYTIIIEKVAEFAFDQLGTMKMEENPVALSFINSIIKSCLRSSKLKQIGRNPRFFVPEQAQ